MIEVGSLLAFLSPPTDVATGRYACFEVRHGSPEGSPWMMAQVEQTSGKLLLSRSLVLRAFGYKAEFDAGGPSGWKPMILKRLALEFWVPPPVSRYPITVQVFVAGTIVSTQVFARSNVILVTPAARLDAAARASLQRRWTERPAIDFSPIRTSAALYGSDGIRLRATDSRGALVATVHLRAPDWQTVAMFRDTVFPALEQARSRGECRQTIVSTGS